MRNNLVYFWDYSGWVYNCNSFLGCWVNNLVYFRSILVRPVIVIVFLVISTGWVVIIIYSFMGYSEIT